MAKAVDRMKIIIMSGASGSGKTTLAKQAFPGAFICSADDHHIKDGVYKFDPLRVQDAHAECMRRYMSRLQGGANVIVVDNTNTNWIQIAPYVANAQAFAPREFCVELIHLDARGAPKPITRSAHAMADALHARCIHGVPHETIVSQLAELAKMWGAPVPREIARVARVTSVMCDLSAP